MNKKDISKHIKFIALALLLFFPITAIAVEKAQVTSRSPITMTLKKQQSLSIQGATVHNARSVSILSSRNQTLKQFTTTLNCKAPSRKGGKGSCNVKLTLTKAVPIGRYTLRLLDAKRQILATGKFEVKADAVAVAGAKAQKKKQAVSSRKTTQAAKRIPDNQKKKKLGTNQRAGINKRQALSPRKKGDVAKKLPIRPTRKQQAVASQKAALAAKRKAVNEKNKALTANQRAGSNKRQILVTRKKGEVDKTLIAKNKQVLARQKAGAKNKQTLGSLRKANKTRKFTASNGQEASRKKALLTDKTGVVAKKRESTTRRTNELVAKRQAVTGRRKAEAANPSMKQADAIVGGVIPLGRQTPGNIQQRGIPGASVPNINEGLPGSGNAGMESPEEILARIGRAGGGRGNKVTLPEKEEVLMPGGRDLIVADSRGNIVLQLPGFKSSHTIGACEALTVPIAPVGGTPPYQVTATGIGDWAKQVVQSGTGFEVVFPGAAVGNDYSFAVEIRDAAGRIVNGETVIKVRGNPPPIELTNVKLRLSGEKAIHYPVTYKLGGRYMNPFSTSNTLYYNCGTPVAGADGVYQNPEMIGTYADGSRYMVSIISATGIIPAGPGERSALIPVLDRGRNVKLSIAYDDGESNQVTINLTPTTYTYEGLKGKGPQAEIADALFQNDPLELGLFGNYEMKPEDFMESERDHLTGETGCQKTFVRFKDAQVSGTFGTSQINSKPASSSILKSGNMPVVGWVTEGAQVRFRVYLSGELFTGACTNRAR